jgi:hypothetical protein
MTLETLAAVSEIVGTLGVIASLIFVGLQVRQNTTATRAQVHQELTSGYLSAVASITANAVTFAKGIAVTPESFASLTDEEKLVYFSVIFGFFKHFENMHSQYERGLVDRESWLAWSQHPLMYFHQPGVKLWWSLRGGTFGRRFRAFLESSEAPKLTSMVDVFHAYSPRLPPTGDDHSR